ncbi:Predicted archaea-specific methyltransferase [Acidilobus saccharovorans 345-15]|uniref:Predicted archaea-specific methyltransferase n=1 Tax=Acidilobus saccharovorans (strain DSM 16705 / JCM 18335 / VKM B-2471 / 345-15) TaxID=666510 RepID=D9Q221_ACIS3|nr:methyltransferase [Acidilobus saccharovorans]ADL19359.1 Predicted archaea-specific methyltransferase [Acidilobus saccharovorans 345-15]
MPSLEVFEFRPCNCLLLAPWESLAIAEGRASRVKVNVGLGEALASYDGDFIAIDFNGVTYEVARSLLRAHSRRRSILAVLPDGNFYEVELRTPTSYYKLVPLEGGAPTLEINGIHMHRISGTTPLRDAELKVKAAGVRRGDKVLEIGTGLGYTAAEALKAGAKVISVELREEVLWIAERNPWSFRLRDFKDITIIRGDACEVVNYIEGPFDVIIHDPPRLTGETGCLYSSRLYARFFELLRPDGRIFHYTGEPGRARGRSLYAGVMRNLKSVGFEKLRYLGDVMGVVGERPW